MIYSLALPRAALARADEVARPRAHGAREARVFGEHVGGGEAEAAALDVVVHELGLVVDEEVRRRPARAHSRHLRDR